jgi:hypothetical protein
MQTCIKQLLELGKFPTADESVSDPEGQEHIEKIERLIREINCPISNEEALALSKIFGDDGYFGLAQTLMHIIESAPDWPIQEIFKDSDNEWIRLLKHRARFIIKRLK